MIQTFVNELLASGLSEKALGDLVGLSQSHIHRLKVGDSSDTSYTAGKKLEELHGQRCPQPKKTKQKAA